MVALLPLESLVLYLSATPYSASAALGVSAVATQDQEGLARTKTAAAGDQAQQEDAPTAEEAPPSDQALGAPLS